MFNFSPEKLLLVGVIALIVLGPNRLPAAARTVAKVLVELRRMSGSFQAEVRDALTEPRDVLHKTMGEMGLDDVRSSVRSTFGEITNPVQSLAAEARGVASGAGPAGAAAPGAGPPGAGAAPPDAGGPTPAVPDDPSLN